MPPRRKKSVNSASQRTQSGDEHLMIRAAGAASLSPAQLEFNRLMKRLEGARTKHAREQTRLDGALELTIRELMPLIEKSNGLNRDFVFFGRQALQSMKLTPKRRRWFGDLLSGKAADLLADPVGIKEEEMEALELVIEEFGPSEADRQMKEEESDDLEFLRAMVEEVAEEAGVDLNLDDLDFQGDPEEFKRILEERLDESLGRNKPVKPRKPTKAQLEKQRKLAEQEEAKKRDFKSLFKQLAKALHPDLETDPLLKEHKEAWMKRLNTAYASGDLRDMLQIEMEWLGEEAGNLAEAGEEKLRVYCVVLKEQLADLKRQTQQLLGQPQYGPLTRFMDPYTGYMENPRWIRKQLIERIRNFQELVEILRHDSHERRDLIHQWADEHAYVSRARKPGFSY
jgi:hypothetical protein